MQQVIVILIVTACGLWLIVQGWRFLRPKPGGKACGGGCCDGEAKPPLAGAVSGAAPKERTVMILSDDLRARVKARKH